MDKFLEKYNLPKHNEQEAESLNRPITADEIEIVIKKFLETNELTTVQNLWNTAKVVVRGKFIAIQTYPNEDRKISNQQPNPR